MPTTPIRDIDDRREAMHEALRRWSDGYENGAVRPVGEPGDDVNELDEDVGGELVLDAQNDREVAVYRRPDGSELAVAAVDRPQAVEITPAQ